MGMDNNPETHFLQIIPGTGYVVAYFDKVDGDVEVYLEPLTAWGLNQEGDVIPLGTDCDGVVLAVNKSANFVAVLPDNIEASKYAMKLAKGKWGSIQE